MGKERTRTPPPEGGMVTCDVCEQSTDSDTVRVGIGDSVICPGCYDKEQQAQDRLIERIAAAPAAEPVDAAVRDSLVAELRKRRGDTQKDLDRMVEEITEWLQVDADAGDIRRVYTEISGE